MTKHVHADLIYAWADGAEIEILSTNRTNWIDTSTPMWCPQCTYRIKPKNRVRYGMVTPHGTGIYLSNKTQHPADTIKVTFQGDSTKIISVELLNQE